MGAVTDVTIVVRTVAPVATTTMPTRRPMPNSTWQRISPHLARLCATTPYHRLPWALNKSASGWSLVAENKISKNHKIKKKKKKKNPPPKKKKKKKKKKK